MNTSSAIQTNKGEFFDFLKPSEYTPTIFEVGYALSNLCRFTGHVEEFYSVAQHSVLVSLIVPQHLAYEGLMHDCAEAFIGDMSAPLKRLLPQYKDIERAVEMAIFPRLGLTYPSPTEVKRADLVALATEQRDLFVRQRQWSELSGIEPIEPIAEKIQPLPPKEAYKLFLNRYSELRKG